MIKETITRATEARGRFVRQVGGGGHFAEIRIRVEPTEQDAVEVIVDPDIPSGLERFLDAAKRGCVEASLKGPLGGHPMFRIRVTLIDGMFHEVDSSQHAFEHAGRIAFRGAVERAGPQLMEEIVDVELDVSEQYMGNIVGDFNAREGVIRMMNKDTNIISGQAPLHQLENYEEIIRALSNGTALYRQYFRRWEVRQDRRVPPKEEQEALKITEAVIEDVRSGKPIQRWPNRSQLRELRDACQSYVDFLDSDGYNDDEAGDYDHRIFEATMETFYGKDIWKWVNSKLK
jgi:translation elongation factor EF-G